MRAFSLSLRTCLFAVVGLLGLSLTATAVNNLLGAWSVMARSELAQHEALADKAVLSALQATRFEKSYTRSALQVSPVTDAMRAKIVATRAELDAAMADLGKQTASFTDPGTKPTVEQVSTDYQQLAALRVGVDEAFGKALDARDVSLLGSWSAKGDRLLVALDDLSGALSDRIKQSASGSAVFVNIKNAAWRTRASIGEVYSILTQAVVRMQPLTQVETDAMAVGYGKAEAHWSNVLGEIRRGGIPDTITQAQMGVQTAIFSPEGIAWREAVRQGLASGHLGMSAGDYQNESGQRQRSVLNVATSAMDKVIAMTEAMAERAKIDMLRAVFVIALAVLLSLGGLALAQYRVAKPLTAMTDVMSRLSRGDIDAHVPGVGRRDEIGAMAASVQIFKDNLIRSQVLEEEASLARAGAETQRKHAMRRMADTFEGSVSGIIGAVTSAAAQLQSTARSMASTATATASQSVNVASAAEEASVNVNTVAAAAEQLGSSVQEIGRQVESSANLAQMAVSEAAQTGALVQNLSSAAAKIGDVVAMITTIAGQTNLLALNATIEAARAGEAGRGFAVVAAEVKALANQTAKATEEISGQIGQIQAAAGHAVGAIDGIAARIQEISGVATSISAAVEEQGAATQEIVRNVSQAAVGTSEVTGNIAGVAHAVEATGASAGQVLSAANELSRQSEALSDEVRHFLSGVRAA
ncbi:methyl-accepting chemotaxis protein [Methylobacterium sp. C25]|uniref:methyl-accepting chemotaxis protein n=1 Tax=Methylobacterium sp. C25 TaxID=2721622 RepID=UPI001F1D5555|nr:HAMP domain-containing methyl-accepting chemotaxis protein [Methylobacterium sp. C25]